MSIIGAWGFEGQDLVRDGFVHVSDTNPSYSVDVPPLGASTRSLYFPSISRGLAQLDSSPSGNDFWLHSNFKFSNNNNLNDTMQFGWRSGADVAGYVTRQNNTGLIQINVDGAIVATSVAALPVESWVRIHVHVDYQNSGAGFVHVYANGDIVTPVVSFTGNTNPSALGAITTVQAHHYTTWMDDLLVMDPNDGVAPTDPNDIAFASIGLRLPNADGADSGFTASPGTGADYEDVDEIPNDNSSFLRATAASTASTFEFENATLGRPLAVRLMARTVRSGTSAGVNIAFRQRLGATTTDGPDAPCPGDGDVRSILNTDANGAAWTTTSFDNSEFGFVSKT